MADIEVKKEAKRREEAERKRKAEEEAARKAAEEETARKAAEEEAARKAAEEEAARKAAKEEAARKAAEEGAQKTYDLIDSRGNKITFNLEEDKDVTDWTPNIYFESKDYRIIQYSKKGSNPKFVIKFLPETYESKFYKLNVATQNVDRETIYVPCLKQASTSKDSFDQLFYLQNFNGQLIFRQADLKVNTEEQDHAPVAIKSEFQTESDIGLFRTPADEENLATKFEETKKYDLSDVLSTEITQYDYTSPKEGEYKKKSQVHLQIPSYATIFDQRILKYEDTTEYMSSSSDFKITEYKNNGNSYFVLEKDKQKYLLETFILTRTNDKSEKEEIRVPGFRTVDKDGLHINTIIRKDSEELYLQKVKDGFYNTLVEVNPTAAQSVKEGDLKWQSRFYTLKRQRVIPGLEKQNVLSRVADFFSQISVKRQVNKIIEQAKKELPEKLQEYFDQQLNSSAQKSDVGSEDIELSREPSEAKKNITLFVSKLKKDIKTSDNLEQVKVAYSEYLNDLGLCYQKGQGVTKNMNKAIELWQKAADLGNSDAMFNLGVCYKNSYGVQQNMKKAIELYERAADLGDADAMFNLAICYQNGTGVPKDLNKAVELYQRAADLGNSNAMFNLAVCYKNGTDVTKDMKKAIELYQKATNQSHADAMNSLAICYQNGTGVTKDLNKAIELFQRAADLDNARAMFNLGVCYENGTGVPKDMNKAIELWQKAADLDNARAMFNLGVCYENGTGVPKDMNKAIELWQKAADLGNSDAMFNLGVCYKNGIGIEEDKKKAIELWQKAADLGDADAESRLKEIQREAEEAARKKAEEEAAKKAAEEEAAKKAAEEEAARKAAEEEARKKAEPEPQPQVPVFNARTIAESIFKTNQERKNNKKGDYFDFDQFVQAQVNYTTTSGNKTTIDNITISLLQIINQEKYTTTITKDDAQFSAEIDLSEGCDVILGVGNNGNIQYNAENIVNTTNLQELLKKILNTLDIKSDINDEQAKQIFAELINLLHQDLKPREINNLIFAKTIEFLNAKPKERNNLTVNQSDIRAEFLKNTQTMRDEIIRVVSEKYLDGLKQLNLSEKNKFDQIEEVFAYYREKGADNLDTNQMLGFYGIFYNAVPETEQKINKLGYKIIDRDGKKFIIVNPEYLRTLYQNVEPGGNLTSGIKKPEHLIEQVYREVSKVGTTLVMPSLTDYQRGGHYVAYVYPKFIETIAGNQFDKDSLNSSNDDRQESAEETERHFGSLEQMGKGAGFCGLHAVEAVMALTTGVQLIGKNKKNNSKFFKIDANGNTTIQTAREPLVQPRPEPKSGPEPQPRPKAETQPEAEPKPKPQPQPQPQPVSQDGSLMSIEFSNQPIKLHNTGHDCYINSVLQIILNMPAFAEFIMQIDTTGVDKVWEEQKGLIRLIQKSEDYKESKEALINQINTIDPLLKHKKIVRGLQRLVVKKLSSEQDEDITLDAHSLATLVFGNNRQQDAQEFYAEILNSIESCLSKQPQEQVQEQFRDLFINSTHQKEYEANSKRATSDPKKNSFPVLDFIESQLGTPLQSESPLKLQDLVQNQLTTKEEGVKYTFPYDMAPTKDTKVTTTYTELPPVLFLQLQAFKFNRKTLQSQKKQFQVDVPEELSLSVDGATKKYRLYGVVNHLGSTPDSGHYTTLLNAQMAQIDGYDKFLHASDTSLTKQDSLPESSSEPYLYFYVEEGNKDVIFKEQIQVNQKVWEELREELRSQKRSTDIEVDTPKTSDDLDSKYRQALELEEQDSEHFSPIDYAEAKDKPEQLKEFEFLYLFGGKEDFYDITKKENEKSNKDPNFVIVNAGHKGLTSSSGDGGLNQACFKIYGERNFNNSSTFKELDKTKFDQGIGCIFAQWEDDKQTITHLYAVGPNYNDYSTENDERKNQLFFKNLASANGHIFLYFINIKEKTIFFSGVSNYIFAGNLRDIKIKGIEDANIVDYFNAFCFMQFIQENRKKLKENNIHIYLNKSISVAVQALCNEQTRNQVLKLLNKGTGLEKEQTFVYNPKDGFKLKKEDEEDDGGDSGYSSDSEDDTKFTDNKDKTQEPQTPISKKLQQQPQTPKQPQTKKQSQPVPQPQPPKFETPNQDLPIKQPEKGNVDKLSKTIQKYINEVSNTLPPETRATLQEQQTEKSSQIKVLKALESMALIYEQGKIININIKFKNGEISPLKDFPEEAKQRLEVLQEIYEQFKNGNEPITIDTEIAGIDAKSSRQVLSELFANEFLKAATETCKTCKNIHNFKITRNIETEVLTIKVEGIEEYVLPTHIKLDQVNNVMQAISHRDKTELKNLGVNIQPLIPQNEKKMDSNMFQAMLENQRTNEKGSPANERT